MLNKVFLIGNLAADPETRNLQNGDPVVHFRMATTEKWKTQDGERKERTEWHNVVIFNTGLCKVAQNHLKKGSRVYVEGKLQTRKWKTQDDQDRYTTEVVLQRWGSSMILLSERGSGGSQGMYDDDSRPPRATQPGFASPVEDDEIPF